MAKVVWPSPVMRQLTAIARSEHFDDPIAAQRIVARLWNAGQSLSRFPNRGRPAPGDTRVLTTVPPYLLRYQVTGDTVTILSIRHGARRPLD